MTTDNKDGDQHLGVVKGSGSPRLYYQGNVGPTTSPHTHALNAATAQRARMDGARIQECSAVAFHLVAPSTAHRLK